MRIIVFLILIFVTIGTVFSDENSAVTPNDVKDPSQYKEEERVSLYDYYLSETAGQLGIPSKKERPDDRFIGRRFSLLDEKDSSLQLDTLDSKTRARIQTKGDGAGDDQKEITEQIRLGLSLHLIDDLLTIFMGGATGDKITDRYTQISGGHKEQEFHFNIRNLYAELQPVTGMRFSVGSFSPYHGLGTQATLKDADIYLTGYRLQLDLKTLLADSLGKLVERVTAESSFFGDETKENVFSRLDRLWGSNNSNSVLIESAELVEGFKVAVGFERFDHRNFVPLQAAWKIDKVFIKDIIAESLIEAGGDKSYAVGVHARVTPVTKLIVQAGFTIVSDDFDYPYDIGKYPSGERFDVTITYILPYGFTIEGFYGDEFRHIDDLENIRAEFSVSWDALRYYEEWRKANKEKKKP